MRIDEARSDDQIRRIQHAARAIAAHADFGDPSVDDSDVAMAARRAGAVNDNAVANKQVVSHNRKPRAMIRSLPLSGGDGAQRPRQGPDFLVAQALACVLPRRPPAKAGATEL